MFFQLFKYKIIKLLHTREELFWALLFPILLGSMFYVSFGNISETEESFQAVKVAVVSDGSEEAKEFVKIVETMSQEEDKILEPEYVNEDGALELLEDGKVDGIIYASRPVGSDANKTAVLTLSVTKEGLNQTILKYFLDEYSMNAAAVADIIMNKPENIEAAISILTKETSYNKEISFTNGNMDVYVQYFYNLIAMACLYGCFFGLKCALSIQGNLSAVGARRLVAPTNRMMVILADVSAAILIQFACVCICLFYLIGILGVDFGHKIPQIMLVSLIGSVIGVTNGLFVGSIGRFSEGVKNAILIGTTMILCFLSGLMYGNMRNVVEKHFPLFNKINPAALLTDAFYALNIYDDNKRFTLNMGILLVMSAVLCISSFYLVRREKYASL